MGPRGRLRPWGVWGCGDTSGLTRPHRAASLSALLELIVHAGGQQLRAVGGAAVGMGGSSSTAVGALQGQWEPPAQGTYLPPCEGPARPRAAPGPAQLCKAPAPELSPWAQPYGVLSRWGVYPFALLCQGSPCSMGCGCTSRSAAEPSAPACSQGSIYLYM